MKILFFTPLAGRTGSEMMLWYLLKHFDRTLFEAQLVSFTKGELLDEMPPDVLCHCVPRDLSLFNKVKKNLGFNPITHRVKAIQKRFGADVWYLNTLTMPEMVLLAEQLGVKVITHFHELPLSYGILTLDELQKTIQQSAMLIGCATIVSQRIQESGGSRVVTQYEMIDCDSIDHQLNHKKNLREKLGIAPTDFVWVMSGTTAERKGFDFIPEIARLINNPHVHLVWLGSRWKYGTTHWVEQLIKQIDTTKIHLLGARHADYYDYLQMADGFMLTSREDPFPLVMLEAAYLQKPIVAFNSGGVSEFVEEGMGKVINSWNIPDFVEAMVSVMNQEVGFQAAIAKAKASEFDVKVQVPKWEALMLQFAKSV